MPTDTGSRRVLVDPGLPELFTPQSANAAALARISWRNRRKLTRSFDSTPAVVVPQPETDHSSISDMTLELERLEIQGSQASHKRSLLSFGDHIFLVAKACWH